MNTNSIKVVIAGTDTGVGKTILSAVMAVGLEAYYWKPIQSGYEKDQFGYTDRERVKNMGQIGDDFLLPEAYVFEHALSPHAAAELEDVEINPARLSVPCVNRSLVIEMAGGLMVPLRNDLLSIDLLKHWELPVLICSRTKLGTINHTLLSIEALKSRGIPVLGVVFSGEAEPVSERAVRKFTDVPVLGRIPFLNEINRMSLKSVFDNDLNLSGIGLSSQIKTTTSSDLEKNWS